MVGAAGRCPVGRAKVVAGGPGDDVIGHGREGAPLRRSLHGSTGLCIEIRISSKSTIRLAMKISKRAVGGYKVDSVM